MHGNQCSQSTRGSILSYNDLFFRSLEVYEDIENGKNYKSEIYASIVAFIQDSNSENAKRVYESFFKAYWIGIQYDKNPFIDLIQKIKQFEENAGILLSKQRDHYIHSVNVFLLGLAIFTGSRVFQNIVEKAILNRCDYPDAYSTRHEEFFYRWGVAALFHDVAYPLEMSFNQAKRYLNFICNYPETASGKQLELFIEMKNISDFTCLPCITPMPEFSDKFLLDYSDYRSFALEDSLEILANKICRCFGTGFDLVNNDLKQLSSHTNRIDHGLYSSLIVLRWYYYLLGKTNWHPAYFYFPVVDAASAILLHNYYKHHLMNPPFNVGKLRSNSHPISFLLILCDELQEWNRIGYGEDATGQDVKILSLDIEISDKLEIIYEMKDIDADYVLNKQKSLEDILYMEDVFPGGTFITSKGGH